MVLSRIERSSPKIGELAAAHTVRRPLRSSDSSSPASVSRSTSRATVGCGRRERSTSSRIVKYRSGSRYVAPRICNWVSLRKIRSEPRPDGTHTTRCLMCCVSRSIYCRRSGTRRRGSAPSTAAVRRCSRSLFGHQRSGRCGGSSPRHGDPAAWPGRGSAQRPSCTTGPRPRSVPSDLARRFRLVDQPDNCPSPRPAAPF